MVTIPLRTLNPIPAGNPVTVAPVGPSNNWYSISAIGVSSHKICASVPVGEIKSKPPSGFTVIVPLKLALAQVPMVVIV